MESALRVSPRAEERAMSDPENSITRADISGTFAALGVLLLVLASLSPSDWYPPAQLLLGLAFLAVSHVLTPCKDQITRWWRSRVLKEKAGP